MKTQKSIAASIAVIAALSASLPAHADTYYMRGQDAAGKSSFGGARSASSIGWATTRDGEPVATATMSGNDFIVQDGTRLRTGTDAAQSFAGASLTIESGGELFLKAGDLSTKVPGAISFSSLIGDGGAINHAVANTQTIQGGSVSINSGSSLTLKLTVPRNLVMASTLTGDETTTLDVVASIENSGTDSQTLELQSAAGFLGTVTGTRTYDRGSFVLKLTGGFGGTITSLPANTSKVLVNIDDATTANGLRVATTTIPAPLRTAVVLYSDTKSNLSPDDVVMTFPAGTTVDPSAFAVAFQQGASGTPEALGLVSVENADGTISLSVTGDLRPGYWTGAAGDCKVSSAGNWSDGAPAAGAALDFSGVQPGTTIIGDTDLTYGAVTIGGKITFSGTFAATSFSDTANISVAANSTVTLDGDLRFSNTSQRYILDAIDEGGKFVLTGDIELTSSATQEIKPFKGGGALVAKGLVSNGLNPSGSGVNNNYIFRLTRPAASTLNWIVGANGISGEQRFFCFGSTSYSTAANIQADDSDFDVTTTIGVNAGGTLNLNTTGYDGKAHKITFTGNGSINQGGTVNIKGDGTVELDNNINGGLTVNVKDTATLSVKRGKTPGNTQSSVTVESGATLEVAESAETQGEASVTPLGNLTLKDGATLGFNFTDRRIAPVLALADGKTATVGSTVYVKVSADAIIELPCGGEHILTSGIDFTGKTVALADGNPRWAKGVSVDDSGNIVLNVKPRGLTISIR